MTSDDAVSFQLGMRQFGAILDAIPARIALLDRDRRHRYANQEYAEFIGQPVSWLLGRTLVEAIGAAAFETVRAFSERALAGEEVQWEGWVPYAEGAELRYVQRIYRPYRDGNGVVDGYFVFVRDLTELKLEQRRVAEQLAALHASQALSAAITAAAMDCVVVIDEAGCVVEFNPAAEQTFGHARSAVLGRPIGNIIVPPHLRERHAEGFARYLATGEAHVLGRRMEIEGLRAGGEIFPLELTITEVRLPDRRLFTAFLRDLTAAKAAAADMQRSREALHHNEKMAAFGSLLAGVAHELNNPLSVVIGNAMMLSEDAAEADPHLSERAERIQAAAERCARIVRTFLSMARQRPTVLRPFALPAVVEGAVELLAYGLRTSGIAVRIDIPRDLPQVLGDPDQFGQVVVNLLVNAQQALAARPDPRRIRIEARAGAEELTLCVSDNGPGVPEAIRNRIFDPFFTTKPIGVGTGIGLAVSRGIVEAHGGVLALVAPEEGGARFEVRLRRVVAASQGPIAEAPAPEEAAATADRGSMVLIVDDEPEVAAVLSAMVSVLGFRCDVATGGAEALERLRRSDYEAILCDVHMPDLSGSELFARLAADKPHLCDRVAFVTADTLGQANGLFLARSGRPVLEKPFMPSEVRQIMETLLAERGGGPGAPRTPNAGSPRRSRRSGA